MGVLRSLLVGAGGMGRAWARTLTAYEKTVVAGWVDVLPGQAERSADELELSGIWLGAELSQALDQVKPDFVVDVTVPEAHHEVTLTALESGVPVIGEKPMAHSMEAAREMVRASEESGKLYMVSQSRRYDARLAAFRKLIDEIGPVGILNVDFYIGAHFGGFRDEMDSPLLLDMSIHTLDQARFLCGCDPVSVYAEEFNPNWSWFKGDVCANALFEMSDGLRFSYRGSWCAEGLMTSWEGDWRAVGAQGTVLWDGHAEPRAERVTECRGFHSDVESMSVAVDTNAPTGIAGSLRDFVDSLESGRTPMGECHDNIKSLAMVFAAMESARSGVRVSIPRLWE